MIQKKIHLNKLKIFSISAKPTFYYFVYYCSLEIPPQANSDTLHKTKKTAETEKPCQQQVQDSGAV